MNIRKFFKLKEDKEKSWEDRLHEARMESLKKKTQVANEIIGMMKDLTTERRASDLGFEGTERRHI